MNPTFQWAGLTHPGLVRPHNEDAFFIDAAQGVAVVADGMGGHENGEVASALALTTVQESMAEGRTMADAMGCAHRAILSHPSGRGNRSMGTTAVGLHCRGQEAEVCWVGDSRAYLFHDGMLRALTADHSFVQDLVERKILTPEQARTDSRRNRLTAALGAGFSDLLTVDRQPVRLPFGSVVLLCSDGLMEHLSDDDIRAVLARGTTDLNGAAQRLVDAALAGGGKDNVTVVLVKLSR